MIPPVTSGSPAIKAAVRLRRHLAVELRAAKDTKDDKIISEARALQADAHKVYHVIRRQEDSIQEALELLSGRGMTSHFTNPAGQAERAKRAAEILSRVASSPPPEEWIDL